MTNEIASVKLDTSKVNYHNYADSVKTEFKNNVAF